MGISAGLWLVLLFYCFTVYVSDENQNKLAVAHFTEGNVEIIQDLKVTNTHVILEVQGLSLFGIIMKYLSPEKPIHAQILLFYEKIHIKQKRKRALRIHMLPENVPVDEVIYKSNLIYLFYSF